MNKLVLNFVNDAQEQWTNVNGDEQAQLLDLLNAWKKESEGRDIILLGGDVHHAGQLDTFKEGRPAFKQLISSGVAQVLKGKLTQLGLMIASEVEEKLKEDRRVQQGLRERAKTMKLNG